jgi:Glycosyl hydrolases family 16.
MKNIAKKNICHMIVLLLLTIIGNVQAASPIKKGYKLLFEETFRGDTLNTNDWYYREGRREGLGWVDGLNRKENVYVKDGLLHIILKRESINGRMENTGGGIITKHDFGYGYYECLSKPFMAGHGVHSSFWQRGSLTPNNDIFEIDSYEIDSKTFVATNNLYVSLAPKGMKYSPWPHRAQVPFTLDKDGWFLDAYEYTPDGVIFYDNNKVVAKADWHELNAAQMVWLTALNGVGKLDTTKLPGESIFKYFRYYAKDYPGVNILPNGNFEFNQDRIPLNKPVSWIVEGTEGAVNVVEGSAFRDNYKLRIGKDHPFFASVQQSLNYIMNGNYQLKAMVRTSNKLKDATIKAFGFGGKEVSVNIKNVNKWTKIVIPIIAVTNNHVSIAVSAAGNAKERFEIDDIQFLKPALKVKKNSKYRSFWDKDAPIWKLATKEPINFKGDQKFYFFDRNVGYGDSITVSFTVNAAVQANMTPIARIPQKGDSGWAIQLTKMGG